MLDRGTTKGWFSSPEIVIEAMIAGIGVYLFLVHMLTAQEALHSARDLQGPQFRLRPGADVRDGRRCCWRVRRCCRPICRTLAGYSVTQTGLLMVPRGFGTMFAMMFAGRLTMKLDPRLLMTAGAALLLWSMWDMTGWTPRSSASD